jgi:hypothetical protein
MTLKMPIQDGLERFFAREAALLSVLVLRFNLHYGLKLGGTLPNYLVQETSMGQQNLYNNA